MTKRDKAAYLLLAPTTAFFILFTAVPIVMVCRLSLFATNYNLSKFVGLLNYANILTDRVFWQTVVNTGLYVLFIVPIGTGLALAISLYAYNTTDRMRDYVRFAYYIPSLATGIIMGRVWKWVFEFRKGAANYLLSLVGIGPVWWFGNRLTGIFAVSLVIGLFSLGIQSLLFMAMLTAVPQSMIDAAVCDGATPGQIRRRILIPMVSPVLLFVVLTSIIGAAQIWETIYVMTKGGPANSTASVIFNIYATGFIRSQYGVASAKSLVMMVLLLVVAMVKRRLERKEERFV